MSSLDSSPVAAGPELERVHLYMPIDLRSATLAVLALVACVSAPP